MKYRTAALATALLVGGGAASAVAAPMSVVYSDEDSARTIFAEPNGISPAHGLYRQDPGVGGVFRDGFDHHRLAKVNGHQLAGMTVAEMVSTLTTAIDGGDDVYGGDSNIVMVDEIGNKFRDRRAKRCYKRVSIRGKRTVRIACQNRIKLTKNGWKLIKRKVKSPARPGRSHPGSRLYRAMKELDAMPFGTEGESYADRVHFYVAPALVTMVGVGRGPHFTFNRKATLNIRPGIRGVAPALARAGGVWLQMYHGNGKAVSVKTWRLAAKRFDNYMRRHGGTRDRVHFMMSQTTGKPRGASCKGLTVMGCNWKLAKRGYNKRALRRGVGVWNAGDGAAEWRDRYKAFFGIA